MKQLKIIDKTKHSHLELEKNQDIIKNLNKLKHYASNYNAFNKYVNENDDEEFNRRKYKNEKFEPEAIDPQNISQAEVESLMPEVFAYTPDFDLESS